MKEYIVEFGDALYNEETGEAVFHPKVIGELIRCKQCTHCFEFEIMGASFLICKQNLDATKIVDGSEWCCWGKKAEE